MSDTARARTGGLRDGPAGRAGGHVGGLALIGLANLAAHVSGVSGANLAMAFLAAVLISAASFGLGPALTSAMAAALTYNFFFLTPRLTLRIEHPADLVTFAVLFLAAVATGGLAGRARDQARRAAEQAQTVSGLLEASLSLSAAATEAEAARVLVERLSRAGVGAALVLTPRGPHGALGLAAGPPGLDSVGEATLAAAGEAWTAADARSSLGGDWSFRRVDGAKGPICVIGLRGVDTARRDSGYAEALIAQGAAALERARLAQAEAENVALRRADELRSALLNSISHDFRTPLASVMGAATTLRDFDDSLAPAVKRDLLESIAEDAERLNRHVGELLDIGRLEGGALAPRRDWLDAREAANGAIARMSGDGGRRVRRDFARDLSKVKADRTLLEQALLNLLENAATHGGEGPIEVACHEDPQSVVISVEDEGPGAPPEALDALFDRYRRLDRPSDRGGGLGLGLFIARGFVEALGGRIAAQSPVRDGRGMRMIIRLPKTATTPRGLL